MHDNSKWCSSAAVTWLFFFCNFFSKSCVHFSVCLWSFLCWSHCLVRPAFWGLSVQHLPAFGLCGWDTVWVSAAACSFVKMATPYPKGDEEWICGQSFLRCTDVWCSLERTNSRLARRRGFVRIARRVFVRFLHRQINFKKCTTRVLFCFVISSREFVILEARFVSRVVFFFLARRHSCAVVFSDSFAIRVAASRHYCHWYQIWSRRGVIFLCGMLQVVLSRHVSLVSCFSQWKWSVERCVVCYRLFIVSVTFLVRQVVSLFRASLFFMFVTRLLVFFGWKPLGAEPVSFWSSVWASFPLWSSAEAGFP